MVSHHAATAVGLTDRGRLETGQRADFLLVDDAVPGQPRVVASVVAGALRFALRAFESGTLR